MKKQNTKTKKYKTEWDLSPLFKSDNDPKMAKERKVIEREVSKFVKRWKNRTDYLKKPALLKKALDDYEKWLRLYGYDGSEGYYLWLKSDLDQSNSSLKAKCNKWEEFSQKIGNEMEFFVLSLGKITKKDQKKFLQDKSLKDYRHFLEKIFRRSVHFLSEPEEKILNLAYKTSHMNWMTMLSGFLAKEEREVLSVKGKKEVKNFSEIAGLLNSKNKKVRDSADKAFNEILEKHSDVAEAEINSILENKKTADKLRNMPRPDHSRHLADDMDSEVVETIVETISARFDISRRFYRLKAKMMGVDKLEYHERNIDLGNMSGKYTYKKSVDLVMCALESVDKKFSGIFRSFLEKGQIDFYPKKGKRGGGYCAYNSVTNPIYILLNHNDELADVQALAHEMGHAINDELMREKQNALNFGTPLSTAESASTFTEELVLEKILEGADDELKLSIMMKKLGDNTSAILRQAAFYLFETELHETFNKKGYVSKKEIGKMFQRHMVAYMGNAVEQSPGSENWWIYVGHLRRFFYNYQYATGMLIASSLRKSTKEDPEFVEKVKEFFSAGSSDSPKNIFKKLGINIADKKFWNRGLDEIEELLKETEKLAKKLGKI